MMSGKRGSLPSGYWLSCYETSSFSRALTGWIQVTDRPSRSCLAARQRPVSLCEVARHTMRLTTDMGYSSDTGCSPANVARSDYTRAPRVRAS